MIAETIDDKTGQHVALAVTEAVIGSVEAALAQRQRCFQPLAQQRAVQRLPGLATVNAGADQGVRIDKGATQRLPAGIAYQRFLARSKSVQRTLADVYFVAEDPEMTGA